MFATKRLERLAATISLAVSFRFALEVGFVICYCLFSHFCVAQAQDSTERAQRKCVTDWTDTQVKIVREQTNHNDSRYIDGYFKTATGNDYKKLDYRRRQWCAVFVTAAYKHCGVPIPIKGNLAAVKVWESDKRFVLERTANLYPADAVTFNFGSHIGIVEIYDPNPRVFWIDTSEGNTTNPNDPRPLRLRQQGAFKKRRLKREVKSKIRIINPPKKNG
jgi:hypothetical protein